MTVISLAQARQERRPHWQGKCICLGCRHEWEGVGEVGCHTGLECPECGLEKGVTRYLYGAQIGDAVLACNCGCEALTAYIRARDGYKVLRCMACGTDQTETYFG